MKYFLIFILLDLILVSILADITFLYFYIILLCIFSPFLIKRIIQRTKEKAPPFSMNDFRRHATKFFEEDLLRVIFTDDDFCICNVANHVYALFPFPVTLSDRKDFEEQGFFGICISKEYVSLLVQDVSYIRSLAEMDPDEINKLSFRLNEKNYSVLKKCKHNTDLNGPTKDIDFEMEEKIARAVAKTGSK